MVKKTSVKGEMKNPAGNKRDEKIPDEDREGEDESEERNCNKIFHQLSKRKELERTRGEERDINEPTEAPKKENRNQGDVG